MPTIRRDYYSPSSIKKYVGCPFDFLSEYGDGAIRVPSHVLTPAGEGTEGHDAVARTLEGWAKGVPAEIPYLRFQVDRLFNKWKTDFRSRFNPGVEGHMIEKEWWSRTSGDPTLMCRIDYAFTIPDETVMLIFDWKFGRAFMSREEVETDIQFQMQAALAFWNYPKLERVIVGPWYVRTSQWKDVTFTRKDHGALERSILKWVYAIESDTEFLPTPGAHCPNCDAYYECPAMAEARMRKRFPREASTVREAEHAAVDYSLYNTIAGCDYDNLRQFLERDPYQDELEVNGLVWGWDESDECSVDCERALTKFPVERLAPFLKFDAGKKSRVWKDRALVAELGALDLIRRETKLKFGAKKKKIVDPK